MSRLKKQLILSLIAVLLLLPGCSLGKPRLITPTSRDCQPGNTMAYVLTGGNLFKKNPVMKTDQGIYYNSGGNSLRLRYHDFSTGKDVLLCNRPECKHDGNEYCVATNAKYSPLAFQLYDGAIYFTATCLEEGNLVYKLIRVAADGSSLSEVGSYFSTIADDIVLEPAKNRSRPDSLLIHRNKAIMPLSYVTEDMAEGVKAVGTAIMDLETGEVTYADETPVSAENLSWLFVSAKEDCVYYVRQEGKKKVLHCKSLQDGSEESYSFLPNFNGIYVVANDNAILYLRVRGRTLCVHHPADGSNEELTIQSTKDVVFETKLDEQTGKKAFLSEGLKEVDPFTIHPACLLMDERYIYVFQPVAGLTLENTVHDTSTFTLAHVYDHDLKKVDVITIPNPRVMLGEDLSDIDHTYNPIPFSLRFLGDEICMCYNNYVFTCTMESFLSGDPEFRLVFEKTNQ